MPFSASGDDDGSLVSDEERREVVSLETWLNKPDVIYSCQCREVDSSGFVHPRYGCHLKNLLFV